MAAFTPYSFLSSSLGLGTPIPVATTPAAATASAADSLAMQRLEEQVLQAEARQAETQALLDQTLADLDAGAALDEEGRQAELTAEEAATARDLERSEAERRASLEQTQASERARQAAAGIAGGATARVLLGGLSAAAESDRVDEQEDARARLEAIRRETDTARRKDLLDLADARRRADLTRQAAATDTAFAQRSAALQKAALSLSQQNTAAGTGTVATRSLGDMLYGAVGQMVSRW
jgi:hypothetical protein